MHTHERRLVYMHERLVDIACAQSNTTATATNPNANNHKGDDEVGGSGGGQYFLITPKLLSGLVYKPGMRVLCIVSGEHMPQDYNRLDFGHALQRLRAVTGRGRGKGKGRAIGGGGSVGVSA